MNWLAAGLGMTTIALFFLMQWRVSKAKRERDNVKRERDKQKSRAEVAEKDLMTERENHAKTEKLLADYKERGVTLTVNHRKDVAELQEMLNKCRVPKVVTDRLNRLGKVVDVLEDS